MTPIRLARGSDPEWAAPPARIVHLGLGGFFRAHQAWYTAHADDAAKWGIAAFSGRSTDLAERLAAQHGLYTLTTRGPDADGIEVIPNLVTTRPGTDVEAWRTAVANPEVTVVTLTVTEAAYVPGPASLAARLLDGLDARRRADAGPITLVSCDNVADNAGVLAGLVCTAAEQRDPELAEWIATSLRVVGSVVDRITPAPTAADVEAAAHHGYVDAAPVVTEPFAEWILSGSFAAARPAWETAGATFTDDLGPYTRRKLHLLNGAHSLLAYAGLLRGHTEVAGAIADPILGELVEAWWDEAAGLVGGDSAAIHAYRAALVERFSNDRIHHRLAQIAIDGSTKLPMRIVPVAADRLARGRAAPMAATVIGAWIAYVERADDRVADVHAPRLHDAITRSDMGERGVTRRLVDLVAPELSADPDFVAAVIDVRDRFT